MAKQGKPTSKFYLDFPQQKAEEESETEADESFSLESMASIRFTFLSILKHFYVFIDVCFITIFMICHLNTNLVRCPILLSSHIKTCYFLI